MSGNDNLRDGLLDFLEEEPKESIDDSDISDEEEEIVQSEHDSDSEQSANETEEAHTSSGDFFLGRGKPKVIKKTSSASKSEVNQQDDESLKWYKNPNKRPSKIRGKNIVKVLPGLTTKTRNITDEISAFQAIITPNIINDIVRYTNKYIESKRNTISYSRERDCQNTTICEILALFGTLFLIGTKKGSHVNVMDLWNSDGTGIQILRAVMGSKRFLFLLRSLRFDDKSTRNERKKTDKLAPIRSILDSFVNNCKNSYNVSEYVTIDEMLHSFRGRCSFVQYIPSKPAKYGIKIFAMCDAKSFYTSNFEVYCGQQPNGIYKVSNSPIDIVKRLITPIENSGRNLTTDNWYSSLTLAKYLLEKKITFIGTLRKNKREIPPEFLPNKNRQPQSSLFGFQQDTALVSYVPRKNKAVILLSTMHDLPEVDEESHKPEIILSYNQTKGAVDTVDKMCAAYSISRVTRRWPLALFFTLLNIAGINSQILYFTKHSTGNQCRRRIFLSNLAIALMKEQLIMRAQIISLPKDIRAFLQISYMGAECGTSETQPTQSKKRGRCKLCTNTNTTQKCCKCKQFICKKHSKTMITCSTCEMHSDSDS
nr:piggyBac transposable element-derived protein 4-like [Onthophagus taurus]